MWQYQVRSYNISVAIAFMLLECFIDKHACFILLKPIKEKDGGQKKVSGWNTLMHTIVHFGKRKCRWILINPASQGHNTCTVTLDKSSSGCSPLMVHHSMMYIHHAFILPWCFHCLCCPMSYSEKPAFLLLSVLTPFVPEARREKWVMGRWIIQ